MKRSEISDELVISCCWESKKPMYGMNSLEMLMNVSGYPEKVCFAAMERAESRGYIESGISLRTAWVTEKGQQLMLKLIDEGRDTNESD